MSFIKGSVTKEKPKGKPERTLKIETSKPISDAQWAELVEELRQLLKKYGITLA
jgi:hypothetical protein